MKTKKEIEKKLKQLYRKSLKDHSVEWIYKYSALEWVLSDTKKEKKK